MSHKRFCAGHRRHCCLTVHTRLTYFFDNRESAPEYVYVLVLDHSLDAGHVHLAKALMLVLQRGYRIRIRHRGQVQVVEPVLTRAARSNLHVNIDDGHTAF